MNMAVKIMIFTIVINIATGATINLFPHIFDDDNSVNRGGLEYDANITQDFYEDFNRTTNPAEQLEDTSNFLDRIIDKLSLGIWGKVKTTIDKYMFGLSQMFDATIGGFMTPDIRNFWFGNLGIINIIIGISYVIGAIYLYTGRDLRE